MIRKIFAVLGGILSGSLIIFLIEKLGHFLYPLPEGINPNNLESMKPYVENAPFMALFFVIIAYFFGALVSGYIATFIAKDGRKTYALICGFFFLLATIFNMYQLPTPTWFWIVGIVVWYFVLVGYQLASKKITK